MEPMYLQVLQKETGRQIKKLLVENGYTVKDVQNAMGFENPQAVYKWISGRSLPSLDNFVILDVMRKRLPKSREEQRSYMSRNSVPEYRYINYDLELVKNEYELVSKSIMEMQMALDKYNQTVQFEVDI